MIYRLYSDLTTFKTLEFHKGLNILLADKSPGATEKQTRNGAGKTSLVELIHFFLGHDPGKDALMRKKELVDFTFGLDFGLAGDRTIIERTGKTPGKVFIVEGNLGRWPIDINVDLDVVEIETEKGVISNKKWIDVLGSLLFALSVDENDTARYKPTFRSLISYFVRRDSLDAFLTPVAQSRWQQNWDQQVNISYLLGLDWTISQQFETVRLRENSLVEIRKAAKNNGVLESVLGKSAELRTQLYLAQQDAERLRTNLQQFRVLPEYQELEREASNLGQSIASLANANTIDRQLVQDFSVAISQENEPSFNELEELYKEAGVILPESVTKRFLEVAVFHQSIINNRRSYLGGEITAAERRIAVREQEMEQLDARKSAIMAILSTGGALEQQAQLQSELSRKEGEISALEERFRVAEQVESISAELKLERSHLLQRLQQDFREQSDILRKAVSAFEEISKSLYERAGNLIFDATDRGPKFDISMPSDKSKGISNMQIFCFDMMLMKMTKERDMGPGFLIHDSHLFDGVDSRQIARALEVGARFADELDFQYIITMNSDDLPSEFSPEFDVQKHILPLKLTDAIATGGLFGFRFN